MYVFQRVHVKLSDSQIIARVANDSLRPEVPVYCPWSELMQQCWAEDASARPTFKRVVDILQRIYSHERTENLSVGKLTSHNLDKHDAQKYQNRTRRFYCSDDSSDESRAIGDSF